MFPSPNLVSLESALQSPNQPPQKQRHLLLQVKSSYQSLNRKSVLLLTQTTTAYSHQCALFLRSSVPVQLVAVAYLVTVLLFSTTPLVLKYMCISAAFALCSALFTQLHL
ncbi:hypothetical protein TYRP_018699 [Tyrophagus putrescentiae]|nr:hypothetical protein TYRP_018699 [Tyrophagus putrescentiae]